MTWLANFAARIGLTGAAIAVLAVFGIVQTARIEGFKIWPISIDGYKADLAACERDKAQLVQASADAAERAVAARMAEQQRLSDIAEERNNDRIEMQADADRALRDYAARNRVRPENGLRGGGTIAAPSDSGPGVPQTVPADTLVATSYSDLQICTDLASYALASHEWAMDIEARNGEIEP